MKPIPSSLPGRALSALWVAILGAHHVFASGTADEEKEIDELLKEERAEACANPSRLKHCQYITSFLQAGLAFALAPCSPDGRYPSLMARTTQNSDLAPGLSLCGCRRAGSGDLPLRNARE